MTRDGSHNDPADGDIVQSLCWCGNSFVRVPIEDVRAGITKPCRRLDCRPDRPGQIRRTPPPSL